MQVVDSAKQRVLECPELWNKVVAKIDVSHKGFAAMKNMLRLHKDSSPFISQQMKTAPWVLYMKGVADVSRRRYVARVHTVTLLDWAVLLRILHDYQPIEDVVADIIAIIPTFERNGAYRQVYGEMLREQSNDTNHAMLTSILTNFAGNRGIETVAFALLADMYKMFGDAFVATPQFDMQIRLAIACMVRAKRTQCTVIESLKLLLTLCKQDLPQARAVLQQNNHDIMLIVFDIQKNFIVCDSIFETCSSLCDLFLDTWTSVGVNPCGIILGCMQEIPGDLTRQTIGCKQLFQLCKCNGRTSRYTPDTIEGVVYFLQQIQYERPRDRLYNDQREWYLWIFVDEIMRNTETYRDCIHLFSVAFLQNALACNFGTYGDAHKTNLTATRHVDCVQFISSLLQRILNGCPALAAAFVRQDGTSILVKIGHHHTKNGISSLYEERFYGHNVCFDLLLDTLLDQNVHTTGVFVKSIFGNSCVQRKFSIGNFATDDMPTTIPILLMDSLNFFDKWSYYGLKDIRYTIPSVKRIGKTLCLLSTASNEGSLVCVDMLNYIPRFFEFVLIFIAGIERDLPEAASVALTAAVANCDNFIVNIYTVSSVDCNYKNYALLICKSIDAYTKAVGQYRHSASKFKPATEKITAALSAKKS